MLPSKQQSSSHHRPGAPQRGIQARIPREGKQEPMEKPNPNPPCASSKEQGKQLTSSGMATRMGFGLGAAPRGKGPGTGKHIKEKEAHICYRCRIKAGAGENGTRCSRPVCDKSRRIPGQE